MLLSALSILSTEHIYECIVQKVNDELTFHNTDQLHKRISS